VTANRDLAAQLRAQADDAMHRRKVLLVAAVALDETKTVSAAVRTLSEWPGPAEIKDAAIAAIELLSQLTTDDRSQP
jgi:hypothetical protein